MRVKACAICNYIFVIVRHFIFLKISIIFRSPLYHKVSPLFFLSLKFCALIGLVLSLPLSKIIFVPFVFVFPRRVLQKFHALIGGHSNVKSELTWNCYILTDEELSRGDEDSKKARSLEELCGSISEKREGEAQTKKSRRKGKNPRVRRRCSCSRRFPNLQLHCCLAELKNSAKFR